MLDRRENRGRADSRGHPLDLEHRLLCIDGAGDIEAGDDIGIGAQFIGGGLKPDQRAAEGKEVSRTQRIMSTSSRRLAGDH